MTTIFMEFLRILDISIKTQNKNILFFADSFSVHVISRECKTCVLPATVQKHNAFH
jgi:hypothetical protein